MRSSEKYINENLIIGSNIRFLRINFGISLQELAKKLGITFQQIQKYEDGSNCISFIVAFKICQIFQIDLSTLINGLSSYFLEPLIESSADQYRVPEKYNNLTSARKNVLDNFEKEFIFWKSIDDANLKKKLIKDLRKKKNINNHESDENLKS